MAIARGTDEGTSGAETAADAASTFGTPGDFNLRGLWTLYLKEVRRFMKVPAQTLLAPVMTTLIFLAIFSVALAGRGRTEVNGVPFLIFLTPGLVMMAIIQNAFTNALSSLIISKVQGNIVDLLMPPLGPGELVLGLAAGSITRGLLIGLVTALVIAPFVPFEIAHPVLAFVYVMLASGVLSLLGVLGGLWAEKFDQSATLTNFVIQPLSFLSGTFYSVEQLPGWLWYAAHANPFFYMIDGLRFAFTDRADGSILLGLFVLCVLNLLLAWFAVRLVRIGYRLKA